MTLAKPVMDALQSFDEWLDCIFAEYSGHESEWQILRTELHRLSDVEDAKEKEWSEMFDRALRAESRLDEAKSEIDRMRCDADDSRDAMGNVVSRLAAANAWAEQLSGMKFSDRMHAALKSRAETAESRLEAANAEVARLNHLWEMMTSLAVKQRKELDNHLQGAGDEA